MDYYSIKMNLYNHTLHHLSFAPDNFNSYPEIENRLTFNYIAWLNEIFNICQNKLGPDVALGILSFMVNPEDKEELFYAVRNF